MSITREHVLRLTSAMASGLSCSADVLRRNAARNSTLTTEQRELLLSAEALRSLQDDLGRALDDYERSGAVVVATLCRAVVADPLSSFSAVRQWGVCAMTGRTVSELLRVVADGHETLVDARFGRFLRSVWCVSHWELLEVSRFDSDSEVPAGGPAERSALYLQACEEITATLQLTAETLAKRGSARE